MTAIVVVVTAAILWLCPARADQPRCGADGAVVAAGAAEPSEAGPGTDPEEVELHRDPDLGFELSYPRTWVEDTAAEGHALALRNGDDSLGGTFFVNVAHVGVHGEAVLSHSVSDGGARLARDLQARFGNARLLRSVATTVAGEPAHLAKAAYRERGREAGGWTVVVQVFTVHDGKAYAIQFETPESNVTSNLPVFESILESFSFCGGGSE